MCVFLGMTVLGFHGTAALLPRFIDLWHLSATQAGWVLGSMSLAALAATPMIALTDRVDAKWVMIAGALINVIGYAGFGLFADGFYSAMAFRAVMGVGFSLSYMPGTKALADRIPSAQQPAATSMYISSFSICSSLSIVIAGLFADAFGWRWAYVVPAVTNLAGALMLLFFLKPLPAARASAGTAANAAARPAAFFEIRPVLANRKVMGFVVGGFAHSVDLLAARGWTVAFLAFAATLHPGVAPDWNLPLVATVLILLGVPSGMYCGTIAPRFGLARFATFILLCSAAVMFTVGFAASWPYWLFFFGPLVLHNILIMADGGTLSAGAISNADPARRGNTVAFYTMITSVGSFLGPVLFGMVLDLAGGRSVASAWGFAFSSVGLVSLLAAFVLRRLSQSGQPSGERSAGV